MAPTPSDQAVNLIVRGGRVLDPASSRDEITDIAVAGSTIRAIGAGLEATGAVVVSAAGCWVVPGLIDGHAHVYDGVGQMGIDPDEIGVRSGVTTVIDAGSSGWATFDGFLRYVVAPATTRVLALLRANIRLRGLAAAQY